MSITLYENQHLSLMQSDRGFVYGHLSRAQDGEGVAVLVFKTDREGVVSHMLGRYEINTAHADGTALTSITGGVDHGMSPEQAIEQELLEEAGIDIRNQIGWRMYDLGTCLPSKFLDMRYYLYAVDVTGMDLPNDILRGVGDGSEGEQEAYCRWELPHVILGCKCPLVALMAMRGRLLNRI